MRIATIRCSMREATCGSSAPASSREYASRAAFPSEFPWNKPHRIDHGAPSLKRFAESDTRFTDSSLGTMASSDRPASTLGVLRNASTSAATSSCTSGSCCS